jgi:hypothetical protein
MLMKRIGTSVAISLVLLLLLVGSAQAATWQVGGTKFSSGQTESTTSKLKSANLALESTVLGSPFRLVATGVECVECKIQQVGSGASGEPHATGKLKLTGVSISEPAGCKVASTVETTAGEKTWWKKIAWGLWESHTVEKKEGALMTVKVEECAIAGSYKLTGILDGKTAATGVLGVTQNVAYSAAFQKEEGASLKLGTSAAFMTGEVSSQLSGANAGKEWGVVE